MTLALAMPFLAVALSLKSAADYTLTAPVLSNNIEGVGMKTVNGRKLLRSEDFAFLNEAIEERIVCLFNRDVAYRTFGIAMGDSLSVRSGAPIGYFKDIDLSFPANKGLWQTIPYYIPGGYVHSSFSPRRIAVVNNVTNTNQSVFDMMDNAALFMARSNQIDAATFVFPALETGAPVAFTNIQNAYATLAALDTIVDACIDISATNIQTGTYTSRFVTNYTYSTYTYDGAEYKYKSGYILSDWKDTIYVITNSTAPSAFCSFDFSRKRRTDRPMSCKWALGDKTEAVPLDQFYQSNYDIEWPEQAGSLVLDLSGCCHAMTKYAGQIVDCGLIIAARVERSEDITGDTTATNSEKTVFLYLEMVDTTATIDADAGSAIVDFDVMLEMKGMMASHYSWVKMVDYPNVDIYPTGILEGNGGLPSFCSADAKRQLYVLYKVRPVLVLRNVPFRARVE